MWMLLCGGKTGYPPSICPQEQLSVPPLWRATVMMNRWKLQIYHLRFATPKWTIPGSHRSYWRLPWPVPGLVCPIPCYIHPSLAHLGLAALSSKQEHWQIGWTRLKMLMCSSNTNQKIYSITLTDEVAGLCHLISPDSPRCPCPGIPTWKCSRSQPPPRPRSHARSEQ